MRQGMDWRSTPRRPALSPILVCALGFWASCVTMLVSSRTLPQSTCHQVVVVALCSTAAMLLGVVKSRHALAFAVLAAASLGVFVASMQAAEMHAENVMVQDDVSGSVEFEVLEDSTPSLYGLRCTVLVRTPTGKEYTVSLMTDSEDRLYYGERYTALMDVKPVDFTRDEFSWSKGIVASGKAAGRSPVIAQGLRSAIIGTRVKVIERIGGSEIERALVNALVCGYRADLKGSDVYGRFQTCGLAHMIAVSGAHLVIVTSFIVSILKLVKVPRRFVIGLTMGFMAMYIVMSGGPVSVVRASLMSSVGLLSLVGKRRPSSLNALGIVVFAVIGTSPHAALSVSFALSTLSTLGIVLFSPLFSQLVERVPLRLPPAIVEPMSLTVSASLLSMGVSCSTFGQLPLLSPLTNTICAPLFPVTCATGLLAAISIALELPIADVLVDCSALVSNGLVFVVDLLARIPYACVPAYVGQVEAFAATIAVSIVLWLSWDVLIRFKFAYSILAFPIVIVLLAYYLPAPDSVIMLNVGQGDAFLVRSCGESLLVDTGNQDAFLLKSLGRHGIAHIDSVLLTHADDDHCGSMDALGRAVDVSRVIMSDGMKASADEKCASAVRQSRECADEVVGVSFGDSFDVGRFTFAVVWPRADGAGENEDSVCLLGAYDGDGDGQKDASVLFTGDAESDQLEAMVESGVVGRVDILKVGHHGSRKALTSELVEQLKPTVALIGVGANNRYGHPAPETLETLDDGGATVFRSDIDGDVSCIMSPNGFKVVVEG